jgi:hypothetical protein
LANGTALIDTFPIDAALDLEQGVDASDRFQSQRRDDARRFAIGLASCAGFDIGEREERPARVRFGRARRPVLLSTSRCRRTTP